MIFRDRIYPWIKSIFRKKKPEQGAEGVYAGPESFGGETKKLYEGPDLDVESKPVEDVYAGPEFYEGVAVEPEEGGDLPDESEDAPEEPETDEDDNDGGISTDEDGRPVAVLYAAPAYLADQPPQPPVMCVYAGPEFFAPPRDGDGGQFAPAPEPEEIEEEPTESCDGPRCPSCGVAVPEDAPFCHICGTPLKKDE